MMDLLQPLPPEAADPVVGTWIRRTPDVCGGEPCIRNTRITVSGLVEWRQLGLQDQEMVRRVSGLTLEDLRAAWDYYRRNAAEIDALIVANEAA